ncbi:MAG: hypothetical protein GY822_21800 [Deltaproteobacteria bacterium]|nr:hypothetical protein [Deltaproteobacteria bacterium]
MAKRTLLVVLLALFGSALGACSKDVSNKGSDESQSAKNATAKAEATNESGPLLPVVTADSSTLLFTFVDERGVSQAVASIDEVPRGVKERVYVTDLSHTPAQRQAHKFAFFTDLTQAQADGTYPVTVVSRYRAAAGESGPPLAAVPEGSVVIYSAVWCGYCKKAKTWMKANAIPFIERDVEKTAGAAKELKEKLDKQGVRGGGVPVLDIKGTLVVGFDKARIEKLLGMK